MKIALIVTGLACFSIWPLSIVWPSGWKWEPHSDLYLQMIEAIYATLGVFLLRATRRPTQHLSLIWFTVWSSIAHGTVMAVQSMVFPMHRGHLLGDVPALFIIAAVLGALTPRQTP